MLIHLPTGQRWPQQYRRRFARFMTWRVLLCVNRGERQRWLFWAKHLSRFPPQGNHSFISSYLFVLKSIAFDWNKSRNQLPYWTTRWRHRYNTGATCLYWSCRLWKHPTVSHYALSVHMDPFLPCARVLVSCPAVSFVSSRVCIHTVCVRV